MAVSRNDGFGTSWGVTPAAPAGGYGGDAPDDPYKKWQPEWGYDNGPRSQPYNPYTPPNPYDWTTDYNNGVFSGPGYDERYWQEHGSEYDDPSSAENYWAGVSGKFAAGPERNTGAQKGYDEWFGDLSGPGFTAAGAGQPHGSNFGETAYGGRDLGRGYTEDFAASGGPSFSNYGAESYGNGANRTTFNTGAAFDRFFDPLSEESNSEKLYGQDPGLGAYYDRAYDAGSEKLANAMAAKGLFGSGYAGDEERGLIADLGADRAKNEAGYKLQAAGQSDSERRARMGLAGELASASDQTSLGRSANERSWAGMLDDTELGQENARQRVREDADRNALDRDRSNMDWASMLDKNTLDRSAEDRGWATAADANEIDRSGEARSWSDLLDKETDTNNRTALDYLKTGGDLAAGADSGKYGRLGEGMAGAKGAQDSMTRRYTDEFNRLMSVASAKAGLINDAVDGATKQKIDTLVSTLKARLAAATNGANTSAADSDEIQGLLGELSTLLDGIKGGK